MMRILLRIEWIKTVSRPAFWVGSLFFGLILAASFGSMLYNQLGRAGAATFGLPERWPGIINLSAVVGLLTVLSTVALLTASEHTWRTARQNVMDGLSRGQFFLAKALLVVGLALYLWVLTVVIGGGIGLIGTAAAPTGSALIGSEDLTHLAGLLLFLILAGSVALLFGVLPIGTGGAMAMCVMFLFLQFGLGQALPRAGEWGERAGDFLVTSVLWDLTDVDVYHPPVIASPGMAFPGLEADAMLRSPLEVQSLALLYILLLMGTAWMVLRRLDL